MTVEGTMEMWTCKRYSKEHPGACVEPGKIKVLPVKECEDILKRALDRQGIALRKRIIELEAELSKLRKDN
jgi:hypothetical protein